MKKLYYIISYMQFLLGIVVSAEGQSFKITRPDALGVVLVATRQDAAQIGGSGAGPGVTCFLKYYISSGLSISLGTGINYVTDDFMRMDNFKSILFPSMELKVEYDLLSGQKLIPLVYSGIHFFSSVNKLKTLTGTFTKERLFNGGLITGVGLEYRSIYQWSFYVSGDYRYIFLTASNPKTKYWVTEAGLTFYLPKNNNIYRKKRKMYYSVDKKGLNSLDNTSVGKKTGENVVRVYDSTGFKEFFMRIHKLLDGLKQSSQKVKGIESHVMLNKKVITDFTTQLLYEYQGYEKFFLNDVNEKLIKRNFKIGLEKFYSGMYNAALGIFNDILNFYKYNPLASNCEYWIGECHYATGDYKRAIESFNNVLKYKISNKFDSALFMSGLCYIKLGNKIIAKEYLQELVRRYPDSEYISYAKTYLSKL